MITTIYQKFISRYAETFTLIEMTNGADYRHGEIVPAAVVAKLNEEEFDDLYNELMDSDNEKASWDDDFHYNVVFNDEYDSNDKGMAESLEYCKEYIRQNNGTDESYFADYKGGIVSIVCNETGETVYEEEVR